MVALATEQQLESVMRRAVTDADRKRLDLLLDIASQKVRTHTGRTFTQTTETVTLPVRNGRVRLPQKPVTAVTAVETTTGTEITNTWEGGQVIDLNWSPLNSFELEPFRTGLKWVDVTYTHGYGEVPADVVGIVCDMVAAALDSPPEDVGAQQETVGPFSVTNGSQYPGGVRLTQSMKDALAPYTAPAGTVTAA